MDNETRRRGEDEVLLDCGVICLRRYFAYGVNSFALFASGVILIEMLKTTMNINT